MTFQSACLAFGQLCVLISAWMLYRTSSRLLRAIDKLRQRPRATASQEK
ncbi:hypothetical protein QZN01_06275 [Burkholderia cenocepacia]|nr:hypothetical protein [Burkholderia cenocepacia]MDN7822247.1 hypothetical protein [Burkholderia cenocepacia]HEM8999506.1 hypothetical protein [Burkholderia cenocepacia]